MYIDLLKCPNCGNKGRPGKGSIKIVGSPSDLKIECECGSEIKTESLRDQMILSDNPFVRLQGASNQFEYGQVILFPGESINIKFQNSFDYVCRAFFTRNNEVPIVVKDLELKNDGMIVISSFPLGSTLESNEKKEAKIIYIVCGLTNIDKLPAWYIHFYNAITQLENGFYKSALLDYAVAFETFVESFLNECFKDKFGDEIAEYILKKCWRIEDRSKELLELVTGHRLTENKDLYELWHKKVRQLRNELVHGKNNKIKKEDAETAHQASYQAIAWINSLKLNTIDQDVLSFLHI